MSGIKGDLRDPIEEYVKKVGLFEAEVVAINPDRETMTEVLGLPEKDDEPEYTGISKDGNPYTRLDIWVKRAGADDLFKIVFFLEDTVRTNKEGDKTQYINNLGNVTWAEYEDELPSWFAKRDYREAKRGEEELYGFLQKWLGKLDYSKDTTEVELSWKKLMKGNVNELTDLIGSAASTSFVALATVVSKEKENDETGETEYVQYQGIYNRAFLPTYALKHFRLKNYDDESVQTSIASREFKKLKTHEKFVRQVSGEYGCKNFYTFGTIKDYNPDDNPVTTDEAIMGESTEDAVSSEY